MMKDIESRQSALKDAISNSKKVNYEEAIAHQRIRADNKGEESKLQEQSAGHERDRHARKGNELQDEKKYEAAIGHKI